VDAVKDVDYETAKWKPAADVASVWEIAAHALPYTHSRLCDLTGEPYQREEDWPVVDLESETAWFTLRDRVVSVGTRLQETVDALTPEELAASVPGKKAIRSDRLMDIAVHDAYHAGIFVKLTQLKHAKACV
jgi:hypothetical protein